MWSRWVGAHRTDLRQVAAAQIDAQRLAKIHSVIDALFLQPGQTLAIQAHQLAVGVPDVFASGRDGVGRYIEAEAVFGKTQQVLLGLGVVADETLQLVGGLADLGGRDTHGKPRFLWGLQARRMVLFIGAA